MTNKFKPGDLVMYIKLARPEYARQVGICINVIPSKETDDSDRLFILFSEAGTPQLRWYGSWAFLHAKERVP